MSLTATYSPEDNKLRLYPLTRLDGETYQRVKDAGFIWAAKQELFVAPAWTPAREDLLLELCGEIGDEDTSLVERVQERADRFEDYSTKRETEALRARDAVDAIAGNIPLGQPILIGHHSERRARKDAERIESGMRQAVRLWETSQYWLDRAQGALRHAKYKQKPTVRTRRIKTLEADKRQQERTKAKAERFRTLWIKDGLTLEQAKAIANLDHCHFCFPLADYPRQLPASQYEGLMSVWNALADGIITPAQAVALVVRVHERTLAHTARWIAHLDNRLAYERAMLQEAGGIPVDRTKPEKGGACKCWASPRGGWSLIHRVNKVSVTLLDNHGNGGRDFTRTIPFDNLSSLMSKAEVDAARAAGLLAGESALGFVLLSEASRTPQLASEKSADAKAFEGMKDTLQVGVQVVSAPQLFPTPAELADRVIELAGIEAGNTILEPSAGTGALLDALSRKPLAFLGGLTVVEINRTLCDALEARGLSVHCADFLCWNIDSITKFDRIVMNPPFHNGEDIKHIEHARKMLAPGGRLVAICANGPRQREQLMPQADHWIDLSAGSFPGTGVTVAIVVFGAQAHH